ncbi:MAG: tRNA preQ1(34) S-adenosylmethionine ribosyltransferase-isomerase QueA [Candidatus Cloacimonetes bacterium]|nr:tRNA preQ1(34) S-adenosylmethionine ribosyltransferase-isomerase QueA [Candidatus Cloacimonadota bacterium]
MINLLDKGIATFDNNTKINSTKANNSILEKKSYFYNLPKDLIAQFPLKERSSSRLMLLNRKSQTIEHKIFTDIIDYLNPDDVIVLNTTKVIPARIYAKKDTGSKIEILLVYQKNETDWICMVKPGKRLKNGNILRILKPESDEKEDEIEIMAEILSLDEDGMRLIRFTSPLTLNTPQNPQKTSFLNILEKIGHIPLPPYINRKDEEFDKNAYQTVYASHKGSVAAPTAGLHFTEELLKKIREKGVIITEVVLHVGLGTFKPVESDKIIDHKMHSELCQIPKETANIINKAQKNGKKVIAVGTTTARTLESFYNGSQLDSGSKWTNIFIYPGKEINVIDALITNFHLPESTLLMLVAAFAGYELTMNAYKKAVLEKYRFFSYGDAMLIY